MANLFYCYPQIDYQWQYLSYFEFLLQNLLCTADCMLLMRPIIFLQVAFNEVIFVHALQNKSYALGL